MARVVTVGRIEKGTQVWAPNAEKTWLKASVVELRPPNHAMLLFDGTKQPQQAILSELLIRNPDIQDQAPDLCHLSYMHEPGILQALALRFADKKIYTYAGSIVIALNPYHMMHELYSKETMACTFLRAFCCSYVDRPIGQQPPHVFAIGEAAYRDLLRTRRNQSILVSGESGAGKTETTKWLLQYLANTAAVHREQIEQRVLSTSPLLEAFGNAKTVFNNNSSRFGKFIRVEFDALKGAIVGASLQTFLLERTRVARVNKEERNFHIFYQLLAGLQAEQLSAYHLGDEKTFHYLSQSGCYTFNGANDREKFKQTMKSMTDLGVSPQEQRGLIRVLAAVLHIGNIAFEGGEAARVANRRPMQFAAELMGCDPKELEKADDLVYQALLVRQIKAGTEEFTVTISTEKAEFGRDSLAMLLYNRLFEWLVEQINVALTSDVDPALQSFIGILDIYGFEVLKQNYFEQFCINYANEKLQQLFNAQVLKNEQQEYLNEGLQSAYIGYKDNAEVLDLIENRARGILMILDEECAFPKSTDKTFVQRLTQILAKNKFYEPSRFKAEDEFIVKHYAAKVTYQGRGFLDKNKAFLVSEHTQLLLGCKGFLHDIFVKSAILTTLSNAAAISSPNAPGSPLPPPLSPRGPRSPQSAPNTRMPSPLPGSSASSPIHHPTAETLAPRPGRQRTASFTLVSVASQFKESLDALLAVIGSTEPHFIRCIKPNKEQQAMQLDAALTSHQLRCNGIIEATRVLSLGFSCRTSYDQLRHRYEILVRGKSLLPAPTAREWCPLFLAALSISSEEYRFGKTKVFLRAGVIATLEKMRGDWLDKCATAIQKVWRARKSRQNFLRLKRAVFIVKRALRLYHDRQRFLLVRSSVLSIQSAIRALRHRKRMAILRAATVRIQTAFRAHLARRKFVLLNVGVLMLQSAVRGVAQRRAAKSLLLAKRETERKRKEEEERKKREEEARKKREAEEQERRRRAEAEEQARILREAEEVRKRAEEEAERDRQLAERERRIGEEKERLRLALEARKRKEEERLKAEANAERQRAEAEAELARRLAAIQADPAAIPRLSVEQIVEATAALDEAEQAARVAREEAEQLAKEEAELTAAEEELEKEEKAASPRPRTLPEGQKTDASRNGNIAKEAVVVLSGASLQAQVAEAVQVAMRNILSDPATIAALISAAQRPAVAPPSPASFAAQYEEELRQLRSLRERHETEEARRAAEMAERRRQLEDEWRSLIEADRQRNEEMRQQLQEQLEKAMAPPSNSVATDLLRELEAQSAQMAAEESGGIEVQVSAPPDEAPTIESVLANATAANQAFLQARTLPAPEQLVSMITEKRNSAVKGNSKRQQRWHSHRKQQPEEGSLPIPQLGLANIARPPAEPPKGNDTPTTGLSPRSPISPRSPRSAAEKRALMKKAVEDAYMRDLLQGVSNAGQLLQREDSTAGSMPGLEKGDGQHVVQPPAAVLPVVAPPVSSFIAALQEEVAQREQLKQSFLKDSKTIEKRISPRSELPVEAFYTRPSLDPTALLLKAQALAKQQEQAPASSDGPSFMPGSSEAGAPKIRAASNARESVESAAAAAETERALLEALAAQDAEIMKLKQQQPPTSIGGEAGDESPPPALPPRTKSPHIRTLSEYGFATVDGASSASTAADIMAELALQAQHGSVAPPNPYELSSAVGTDGGTVDGAAASHSGGSANARSRALSISSILEAHHHTIDENQKFEFLRELEEQCKDMEGVERSTQGRNASQSAVVRLSEALREGEAQLKERARRALASVDNAYSEQQLSAIEQEYKQRVEAEFMKELEEESKRMREEIRKTLVSQEERYRRQIEDEFAAKLETQARILEQHYNAQLAEALAQGRRSTSSRSNVSSNGTIEAAMTQRLNERAEELERLMNERLAEREAELDRAEQILKLRTEEQSARQAEEVNRLEQLLQQREQQYLEERRDLLDRIEGVDKQYQDRLAESTAELAAAHTEAVANLERLAEERVKEAEAAATAQAQLAQEILMSQLQEERAAFEAAQANAKSAQTSPETEEELRRLRAEAAEVAQLRDELEKAKQAAKDHTAARALPVAAIVPPSAAPADATSLSGALRTAEALEELAARIEAEAQAQHRWRLEAECADLAQTAEFISAQLALLRSVSASHSTERATLLQEQRAHLLEEKSTLEATLALLRKAKSEQTNAAPAAASADSAKKISELHDTVAKLEKQKAAASAAFQASQDDVENLLRRASSLEAEAAAAAILRQELEKQTQRAEAAEAQLASAMSAPRQIIAPPANNASEERANDLAAKVEKLTAELAVLAAKSAEGEAQHAASSTAVQQTVAKLREELAAAQSAKEESDASKEASEVTLSYLQAELQDTKDKETARAKSAASDAAGTEQTISKLREDLAAANGSIEQSRATQEASQASLAKLQAELQQAKEREGASAAEQTKLEESSRAALESSRQASEKLRAQLSAATAASASAAAEAAREKEVSSKLRADLAAAQATAVETSIVASQSRDESAAIGQTVAKLREELAAAQSAKEESDASKEASDVTLSYLQAELQDAKDKAESAKQQTEKLRAEVSVATAAQAEAAKAAAEREQMAAEMEKLRAELAAGGAAQAAEADERTKLAAETEKLRAELTALKADAAKANAELENEKKGLRAAIAEAQALVKQRAETEQLAAEQREEIVKLREELASHQSARGISKAAEDASLSALKAELQAARDVEAERARVIESAKQETEELRAQLAASESQLASASKAAVELEKEKEESTKLRAQLDKALAAKSAELSALLESEKAANAKLKTELSNVQAAAKSTSEGDQQLHAVLASTQAELVASQEREQSLQEELDKLMIVLGAAEKEKEMLLEAKAALTYSREKSHSALSAELESERELRKQLEEAQAQFVKEQEAINKRADEEQAAERASLLAQVADANRKRAAAESALQQLRAQSGGSAAAAAVVVDDSHLVAAEQALTRREAALAKETEASRASLHKQTEELKAKSAELRRRELELDGRAAAAAASVQTQNVASSPQPEEREAQLAAREAAVAKAMADLQALGAKIKEEDEVRYRERKAFEEQAASREEEMKAQEEAIQSAWAKLRAAEEEAKARVMDYLVTRREEQAQAAAEGREIAESPSSPQVLSPRPSQPTDSPLSVAETQAAEMEEELAREEENLRREEEELKKQVALRNAAEAERIAEEKAAQAEEERRLAEETAAVEARLQALREAEEEETKRAASAETAVPEEQQPTQLEEQPAQPTEAVASHEPVALPAAITVTPANGDAKTEPVAIPGAIAIDATAAASASPAGSSPAAGPSPVSPRRTTSRMRLGIRYATVLYDYEAKSATEMSFKFGDTVEIIAKPDQEEWWSGRVGDVTGYFPKAYVRLNPPAQHVIKKPDSVLIAQMQETLFPGTGAAPLKSVEQINLDKKRQQILAAQGHRDSPKKAQEEEVSDDKQLAEIKKQEQRRKLKEGMLRQQQRRRNKKEAEAGAPDED